MTIELKQENLTHLAEQENITTHGILAAVATFDHLQILSIFMPRILT